LDKDQDQNAEVLSSISFSANTNSKAQDTLKTENNFIEDLN